jgi:hypothetical protein
MLTQLSSVSLTIGLTWFAIGVVYLAWLTRGFRRPTPELSIGEEQALIDADK